MTSEKKKYNQRKKLQDMIIYKYFTYQLYLFVVELI